MEDAFKEGQETFLNDIFFNNQSFRRPETPCGYCLFVFSPLSHGSDDSVGKSTDGMCSANLSAPFQTPWYPNGGVPKIGTDKLGSVRLLWVTFGGGNSNRTAPNRTAPIHTVPYRTVSKRTEPYHTVPYRTIPLKPYHITPHLTVRNHTIPNRIVPHCTALHRTVPH